MTTSEAKSLIDEVLDTASSVQLPEGFKLRVEIPLETANLLTEFYSVDFLPVSKYKFAHGEPFMYKGIQCYAV